MMCQRTGYTGAGTTRKERRKASVSIGVAQKPRRAETPEWIVVDFDGRGFRCERCGASEKHSTPQGVSRLDSFALRGQAFALDHADCKEKSNGVLK